VTENGMTETAGDDVNQTQWTTERVLALSSWHDDWRGLRVAVLGLGVTGFSVADTLVELGARVRVVYGAPDPDRERLLDVIGAERFCAESNPEQLGDLAAFGPDLVVVSPGYRPDHPLTAWAAQRGLPVWGDIELGWRLRDKTPRVADWICITGTNGKTTTTRLIAHLFTAHGWRTAMTNTDGVYVNGRQIDSGDCSGPKSARNALAHPETDAVVLECARGGLLREGLGFDRAQVAVVTNVGEGDHLGLNFIHTVEDVAVLKRVIVQNVAQDGYAVLNAADPHVAAMAASCPGKVIFFAADRHHPVMATHRAQGARVVYVDEGHIVAAEGSWRESIPLRDIPLTRGGTIGFQVENAMASIAAAWGVGLPWQTIRRGLAGFVNDSDNMPGQRRSVVISGAGDRRDQDITEQTLILGRAFDDVILYQDACQRGRADGEVLALLQKGLQGAPRTSYVTEIHGEFAAIDHALARLAPGDLCLVLVDQVEEALAHLHRHVSGEQHAAA
jgi:cyanophycin synthetase